MAQSLNRLDNQYESLNVDDYRLLIYHLNKIFPTLHSDNKF